MKIFSTFILLVIILPLTLSQDGYPVPQKTSNRLFYIQHSNNTNTYVYDANMDGVAINSSEPIEEYRILYTEDGIRKPLTLMQREFAYGMVLVESTAEQYKFRLAANKELFFFLRIDAEKGPRISVTINDHEIYLDRMFITLKEGTTGLSTKAEHVLFYGKDLSTGESVIEKVTITD